MDIIFVLISSNNVSSLKQNSAGSANLSIKTTFYTADVDDNKPKTVATQNDVWLCTSQLGVR